MHQPIFPEIAENQRSHKALAFCECCTSVLDHLSEALFWIDSKGTIDRANRAAVKLSQYTAGELQGMAIYELTGDITPELWFKYWESVRLSDNMEVECQLQSKDGDIAPVAVTLKASRTERTLICAIVRAVHGSKDEHKRLKRVSYEYDRLLYRTSHDLKAPISTVLGLVNLMRREASGHHKDYLDLIEETMDRQQSLMRDINHLSTIGSTEVNMENINVPMLIDDVLATFPKERRSKIQWFFDFKLHAPVYSDRYMLIRILTPIIDNAVRYNNSLDPFVRITVESTLKNMTLMIEDNGMGVSELLSKKIFEMFFRGAESSTGSGLGLYLALITAQRLKGTVELLSTGSNGASFKVEIPNLSYAEFTGSNN